MWAGGLEINLRTSEARKEKRLFSEQQMRAIEFCGDMHREIEVAHRLECHFRIGHRDGKIAAKTDQCLRAPIPDRLDSFDRVVALVAWRLESEGAGQPVQKRITRNLGNADRAISLPLRGGAEWRDAGALAPDIAAEDSQSGDLLHICGNRADL